MIMCIERIWNAGVGGYNKSKQVAKTSFGSNLEGTRKVGRPTLRYPKGVKDNTQWLKVTKWGKRETTQMR